MGNHYWDFRNFLNAAQWWNKTQISTYQLMKFKEIVTYAFAYVPGYNVLYRSAGISPEDINSIKDIEYLPLTTKELLRDNIKDFTTRKYNARMLSYVSTGGSTGIPFGFYHTPINRWVENAFMHTGWSWSGWELGKLSIILRGDFVGTKENIHSYNRLRNEINYSTYYLSDETYGDYLASLCSNKANSIQAYPSAITILSDLMIEHGDIGKIDAKVILLGSENTYPWQLQQIQTAFPNARIFSWYGHAEQAVLAPWCEKSSVFHVWPFYSFVELLDNSDRPAAVGQTGEIVGTSFWNFGTPFIRYRTMDLAENGGVGCPACNRMFHIFNRIEGRLQEFIVTSTGRLISMTAVNMHSNIFEDVKQFQFFQDTPGKVVLRIIPKACYTEASAVKINREIKTKLSEDIEFSLVLVDEIQKTRSGKYRFLEQKLQLEHGE